jgi:hypothetical protein
MRHILLAVSLALLATPSAAQMQEPPAAIVASDALRAADALLEASIPGIADELGRQFPRVFVDTQAANLPADRQAQLRERLAGFPALIRLAMEQRWDRQTPELPEAMRLRIEQMMARTGSGRRGEFGAERAPTREIVAATLAQRFSEAELADIADFLARPEGRAHAYQAALRTVQGAAQNAAPLSDAERAAVADFMRTPSGRAYRRASGEVTAAVVEQLRLNVAQRGRELLFEVADALCDVIGPECASTLPER